MLSSRVIWLVWIANELPRDKHTLYFNVVQHAGFPHQLENLENIEKLGELFHLWKNHGILSLLKSGNPERALFSKVMLMTYFAFQAQLARLNKTLEMVEYVNDTFVNPPYDTKHLPSNTPEFDAYRMSHANVIYFMNKTNEAYNDMLPWVLQIVYYYPGLETNNIIHVWSYLNASWVC